MSFILGGSQNGQSQRTISRHCCHSLGPGLGQPHQRALLLVEWSPIVESDHCASPTECSQGHRATGEAPLVGRRWSLCYSHPSQGCTAPGPPASLARCPALPNSPSLKFKPPQCPGGGRQRPHHWQRSCIPWEAGGPALGSVGSSLLGAGTRSPGPCSGLGVPPSGRQGG